MNSKNINPKNYGLEKTKATELTTGLELPLNERKLLIKEFNTVSELEVNKENIPKFRDLRLRIVKNRTLGINNWHKTAKDFFLKGGQFVDAIKRKEIAVNEAMELKLVEAENHFTNLERQRLFDLQQDRVSKLSIYVDDANERNLSGMDDDVWEAYLSTKKKEYKDKIEAEKELEAERIAKEKAEKIEQERIKKENKRLKAEAEAEEKKQKAEEKERQRLARIESDKLEAERKENERLRLESEAKAKEKLKKLEAEKQKLIDIEREKSDKLEAELKAKKEAELKAENEKLDAIENEAKKGDGDKVKDLINDLEVLKTKYTFKAKKNQTMYNDISILIGKIINHINQ